MIQPYLTANIINTKIITKKDIDRRENNNTFYHINILNLLL